MNSKDRLLNSLMHRPVDRVPISTYELVGYNPDSWENKEPSYRRLMDYIRLKTDCMYMWSASMDNRATEVEVRSWREGERTYTQTTYHTPRGPLMKLDVEEDGIHTVWHVERLLKTDEDVDRYLSMPYEFDPPNLSSFAVAEDRVGDHGIVLVSIPDPICIVSELFDFADFMLRAVTQKGRILALLDVVFERLREFLIYLLRRGVGPLFRICGPEYVTPPYLGPEYFREFVVPYDSEMIELIHDYGCFARVHCHGRIRHVLDMIVEMGADAIDPLEAPPSGDITLGEVKARYGDRLCLMGNIQLRDLEYSAPEDMEAIVRRTLEEGKPGGGFVLMPTAAPIDVPLSPTTERNYFVLIDTALKYGEY
ncbi:MAG: uroporphyrinogen decarboxylase family protein [bacterium]